MRSSAEGGGTPCGGPPVGSGAFDGTPGTRGNRSEVDMFLAVRRKVSIPAADGQSGVP
jgi:hypothetical protein